MLKEFKEFLIKGNMVDMAIGFIFGGAFATLVKSLVANVIMPPVGLLMGHVDFSQLYINLSTKSFATLAEAEKAGAPIMKIGTFMNDTISFVILGFVMFMFIKSYNKLKKTEEKPPEEPTEKVCGECAMTIPIAAKKCGHCGNSHFE